ncbi:hypothetical protein ABK040_004717 [Willaertia magna]
MSITLKGVYASAPNTERGRSTVISASPSKVGKKFTYGSGNFVFIRDFTDLMQLDTYTEHATKVNVAKFSPTGYYIASGDDSGMIRIWSCENVDKTLKLEKRVLSKTIRDLAWTGDSQRIVAVGEGKQEYGVVFSWDMGTSTGEISGHSKELLSCDARPERPFRIATGGSDLSLNFYQGPPFKFSHSNKDHERFINCIRYAPDGSTFASCGSDKKILIFEGKTGQKVGEMSSENGHSLSIYGLAYTSDSKKIVTASGDKTVKLWNVETKQCEATVTIGNEMGDMQVGVCVIGDNAVSVSLNGDLNVISSDFSKLEKKILGHNSKIYKVVADRKTNTFYSCGANGQLIKWDAGVGGGISKIQGTGHKDATIAAMAICGDKLVTASGDKQVRFTPLSTFTYEGEALNLSGSPYDIAVSTDQSLIVIATHVGISIIKNEKLVSEFKMEKEPQTVSISPDGTEVAVGCKDKKVRIYKLAGDNVVDSPIAELTENAAIIKRVRYTPDGSQIVVADSNYEVCVYDAATKKSKQTSLTYHAAAITDMDFSPDGKYMVTSSLDKNIIVWDLANNKRVKTDLAHHLGVTSCCFVDENTIVTAGEDLCLKEWKLQM